MNSTNQAKYQVNFQSVTGGQFNFKNVMVMDESQEIQYVIVDNTDSQVIDKIAGILDIKINEDFQNIPFITPNNFDIFKQLNKILIFGVQGCGKTRNIIEIIANKLKDFDRIIILNPKISLKSKTNIKTISNLVNNIINKNDLVIWDNFPDGLILGQSVEHGSRSLLEISSNLVQNLILSLKSEYLEQYKNKILEINELEKYQISFNLEQIIKIIEAYGKTINRFTNIYDKFIEKDIETIANIIKKRESTPSAIQLYYNNFINYQKKKDLDAILLAKEYELPSIYYKNQFNNFIRQQRHDDAYFLYTIKLCYEIGLTSSRSVVKQLQNDLFNSQFPVDPLTNLSTWIHYSSGRHYSIQDVVRNAISYPEDMISEILDYILLNFNRLINSTNSSYLLGVFFGRYIHYLYNYESTISKNLFSYLNKHKDFSSGFGDGLGEHYISLNENMQKKIITIISKFDEGDTGFYSFPFRIGLSLGYSISKLKEEICGIILKNVNENTSFNRGFGFGIGLQFDLLDNELQDKIIDKINELDNINSFKIGFSNSLRYIFVYGNNELQNRIIDKTQKNKCFGIILGADIGLILPKIDLCDIEKLIERNYFFAWGFGYRICFNLIELENTNVELKQFRVNEGLYDGFCFGTYVALQNYSWEILEKRLNIMTFMEQNGNFCRILSRHLGRNFNKINESNQFLILQRIDNNVFGEFLIRELAVSYTKFKNIIKKKILKEIMRFDKLSFAFGSGIFFNYREIIKNVNPLAKQKIELNYENEDFKKLLLCIKNNQSFYDGLLYSYEFYNKHKVTNQI